MSIKTDAVVIRDEITTGANTATRVGTNLVDIADDLVAKQAAIDLNTAKIGVTTEEANPDVVGQAEAEAGVATTERIWTAERVKQAIVALGGSGSVDDTAYGISWNGVTSTAPSKNALYDFIESQVFKVDENSNIIPVFWGGTQAEYDVDFPSGHPTNYFVVITDAVTDIEGTAVLSTGEVGNIKFLGEDGDNTSSWKQVTSSNILNTPSGNQTNTNLQLVINDLQTQIDTLNATLITPPVAAFSGTPLSINETETVTYTDASTNTPTSWSWVFEGGTPATSTAQNPTVTYNTAGTYDATLTATNAGGSDSEAKVDYVTVSAASSDLFPSGNVASATEVDADVAWTAASSSITLTRPSDVASGVLSGTLSQRLEMNNTTIGKSAWYDFSVVSGTEYTIKFWMKRDATDTAQTVIIAGEWSGGSDENILATTTWTEYTRVVTPSVTGTARITFTPSGTTGVAGVGMNIDHITITY